MARNILEVMKKQVAQAFAGRQFELLAISTGVSKDADTDQETPFVRLEVEVPRDLNNPYSKCRFTIKSINGIEIVTQEEIDEGDCIYYVSFEDLVISYIDNKGNVYFRADSYEIEKGEI